MKKHARHIAIGGIVGPLALVIAAVIANQAQTMLGLDLDNQALAIYIAPFLLGAAAIFHGQLRLEAAKITAELSSGGLDLGGLLGEVLNGSPAGPEPGSGDVPASPLPPAPPSSPPAPPAPPLPPTPPPAP
jgi:hypothetical protein